MIVKEVPFGVYLDGDDWGEILLPSKYVPKNAVAGDVLEVFVYFDSDDKIIATTKQPRVALGHCACLKVIDVNRVGAFLDWGLDKDLLVPVPEQHRPMVVNKSYLVYVKQDNKGRLIASSKLDHFLDKTPVRFKTGDAVDLLIAEATDLGRKVIINNCHWGLIHATDIFQTLHYGQALPGFIKNIRADGKVDVVLRRGGHDANQELAQRILGALQQANGFLPLHDKSTPESIQKAFGVSKKSYKNAIGHLYKSGAILIEADGIRLRG